MRRKLSLSDIILLILLTALNARAGNRIIASLVREYLKERKRIALIKELKEKTFRNALSQLKRDGLIKNDGKSIWQITDKGKAFVKKLVLPDQPNYDQHKKNPKQNLMVIFDIPKAYERQRQFLRAELKFLGFEPFQKSVWSGQGPIPEEFVKYLKKLGILGFVHIFEIKSFGTIK